MARVLWLQTPNASRTSVSISGATKIQTDMSTLLSPSLWPGTGLKVGYWRGTTDELRNRIEFSNYAVRPVPAEVTTAQRASDSLRSAETAEGPQQCVLRLESCEIKKQTDCSETMHSNPPTLKLKHELPYNPTPCNQNPQFQNDEALTPKSSTEHFRATFSPRT